MAWPQPKNVFQGVTVHTRIVLKERNFITPDFRSRAKISRSKNQSRDGNGAVIPLVDTRGSDENDHVIFLRFLKSARKRLKAATVQEE